MATITPPKLLTFDEYQQIPDPPGGRYELYHGELVEVPFPDRPHFRAQWQLRRLIEKAARPGDFVDKEFPYRPLPEHECWGADIAYIPKARFDAIDRWLLGVPDLVVEVISPSKRTSVLRDKREICLENGCREFWVVDPKRCEVEVHTPDGRMIRYKSGQEIPLFFAPGSTLKVDAIFE